MPADSTELSPIAASARDRRPRALVVIALYKFVKTAACIVLAAAAFKLVSPEVSMPFEHWLESLTWTTRHGTFMRGVDWLLGLGPRQFQIFGAAALVYAALYAVQGFGLWFGKRWAEYLVIVETGLLLPFESWELLHRFTSFKLAVLVTNIAILIYLARLLGRHERKAVD